MTLRLAAAPALLLCLLCSLPKAAHADAQSDAALVQLRGEIAAALTGAGGTPIQNVLARRMIRSTTIPRPDNAGTSVTAENSLTELLARPRPRGVSRHEWHVLQRTWQQKTLNVEAEHGNVSLALMDMDGDNRRDLLVTRYVGGTGLFTIVDIYRQTADGLFEPAAGTDDGFYSINGRGSDQAATWIRIAGRVYLAYREGEYSSDRLTLRRAFLPVEKSPAAIVVSYRYRHRLSPYPGAAWNKDTAPPPPALRLALDQALGNRYQAAMRNQPLRSRCAAYGEKSDDELADRFGAGHYTIESAARFWVHTATTADCHAVQLVRFNNSYLMRTADCCQLWVRGNDGKPDYQIPLISSRHATRAVITRDPAPNKN